MKLSTKAAFISVAVCLATAAGIFAVANPILQRDVELLSIERLRIALNVPAAQVKNAVPGAALEWQEDCPIRKLTSTALPDFGTHKVVDAARQALVRG